MHQGKISKTSFKSFYIAGFFLLVTVFSYNGITLEQSVQLDFFEEEKKRLPEYAVDGLEAAPGLEVSLIAIEPMLKNPTNIDVDERGRIWVTEAYNYRPGINGNPTNPDGDRILILEDFNEDGIMDTAKIFYQGPEINAPLGVCVLGNKVLISQSPYVWAFYDDNNDDVADRKEIVFQGIGGEQHDHGMHTFVFGPDGKLYFNFGNEGKTLKDKRGNPVRDQDGDIIGPEKYRQGMVFRSDPDGSNVECLGDNFRNNYELAVDSYGGMWQSDNDDDGNRGVRINYVMDYGNYGYTDEMTGASWQAARTNREDSIPFRHWHLNDPGVVPNLLQTGAGSPTGMVMYEGALLPSKFQNELIHCEPGQNVVRSYAVTKQKAGYKATINNVLSGTKDQWFRPADICVAPDGSLIIADWYDPGVGGHQAGDQQKGRVYRVAPPGSLYKQPVYDYTSTAGALLALQNPNLSVRFKAWNALMGLKEKAIPGLEEMWRTHNNPRMRARAFWILAKMPAGNKYIKEAIDHTNPDFRIMGLRAARQLKTNMIPIVTKLVKDSDAQVRRESAIALRNNKSPDAAKLWAELALQHDGEDRWYLEALGIGAEGQWKPFLKTYLDNTEDPLSNRSSIDIIWRARTDLAIPYLGKLAGDSRLPLAERLRYFRAFDFNPGDAKSRMLLTIISENKSNDLELNKLALLHMDAGMVKTSKLAQSALSAVVNSVRGTGEFVEFVQKYSLRTESQALLDLALKTNDIKIRSQALSTLLELDGASMLLKKLNAVDATVSDLLLKSVGRIGSPQSLKLLEGLMFSASTSPILRQKATAYLGGSYNGEERVLELLRKKLVPEDQIKPLADGVKNAWRKQVAIEAQSYIPGSVQTVAKALPTERDILSIAGNPGKGKTVFQNYCAVCHLVNKEGIDFGPDLSAIGAKLTPVAMFESIIYPSRGISFGYEAWQLTMKDGSKMYGIISSKTETDIELKLPGGLKQQVKTSNVQTLEQMKMSMMPEGMHEALSKQEIADLIVYMKTLR